MVAVPSHFRSLRKNEHARDIIIRLFYSVLLQACCFSGHKDILFILLLRISLFVCPGVLYKFEVNRKITSCRIDDSVLWSKYSIYLKINKIIVIYLLITKFIDQLMQSLNKQTCLIKKIVHTREIMITRPMCWEIGPRIWQTCTRQFWGSNQRYIELMNFDYILISYYNLKHKQSFSNFLITCLHNSNTSPSLTHYLLPHNRKRSKKVNYPYDDY